MNGAAHASPGSLSGVILSESVSVIGGSHETVFDANPQNVRVPALVLANNDDLCGVAPPTMAPTIASAMANSPDVKIAMLSGGIANSSRDCSSLSPHGYYGIEEKAVSVIDNWIKNHPR